jgi:hypothetical protein
MHREPNLSRRRVDIVVTTIFEPRFLDGYVANLDKHGHDDTGIIVITDRKTPPPVYERCAYHARRGRQVICLTLDEQEQFLSRFGELANRVPYDSDNRRNIGFLMALERGADVMITIDDDNYVLDDSDFVGEHLAAGTSVTLPEVSASDGWINLCGMLESNVASDIFPRGFPYFARRTNRELARVESTADVAVNVGLWLSDPDVDAMTRLTLAPNISAFRGDSILLGRNTWTPINTQNTAVVREAIAAYYYVRMGFSLGGLRIDRYGDILSGYLLQKAVKTRGAGIRIGTPIADHRRTPHNLFKDLYHELAGMVLLEDILPWLQELPLESDSYAALYASLADALEEKASTMRGFVWDEGGGDFLRDTAANMRAWLHAVALIG